MQKTLYVFVFNNGDVTESDAFVADINLSNDKQMELAYQHLETEYEYSREFVDITEIYEISEENIELIVSSRK